MEKIWYDFIMKNVIVPQKKVSLFGKEYAKLNPDQKRAVDTVEGPVMVIAGPGTGKTQVSAMRVAQILQKTQMRPSNILCLTFSTSGTVAMRERLRMLIGSDAYGVTVNTIHGFCNDLIASHPEVFEEWSALEKISDVERYREVNKIIDQFLPHIKLINKKNPYMRTGEILSRISQLKREGKTDRSKLLRIAEDYRVIMEGKSKEGTKVHAKNILMAQKFRDLLDLFFAYQEMLARTQRYDYEDMILFCLEALLPGGGSDWLLSGLQERYQYILVDEFQDTNGAQYQLIERLSTYENLDHQPNLFVVGDDDQAIYRFQGANLTNLLSFRTRFPAAPVIVLTMSYRSVQPILDAAGDLIAKNMERLVGKIPGLQKDLKTSFPKDIHSRPKLLFSPSDAMEPWFVADLIEERLKSGQKPDEIAVLTQTNAELLLFHEVLRARQIPVSMRGKANLLSHPKVRQAVTILKAVHDPSESSTLAAALSCECFGCHPADLGRLFCQRQEEKKSLLDVLLYYHDVTTIIKARDTILDIHHKIPTRTIIDTLEHILKECNLLPSKEGPIDPLEFAPLQELFDRLKYRAYEQPNFSLDVFLSDLEYYQTSEYGELRLSYELPHLTEQGTQLMTAHQSKGLEFETVILANFREGHWNKRRNPPSIHVPEDLLFGWGNDQKSYEQSQDERRVAYVAMTRAKKELIFTCPRELTTGEKIKAVSPSVFFAEAGDFPEEDRALKDPEKAALLLHAPMRVLDTEFKAFLHARLKDFRLSVTALNHFIEDPQKFLEIDLLHVPQSKDGTLVYGNAVHFALRKWGTGRKEEKNLSLEEVLGQFEYYLSEREILIEKERQRLIALGGESLPRYFDQRLGSFTPFIYKVEFPITTYLGDIPLRGLIDRIDLEGPESARATVIDYKTGRPKAQKEIKDNGYFRQLVFYALLLEHGQPLLRPEWFILDFVGEGEHEPIERKFQVTEGDKKELSSVISDVWKKIHELDFSTL